MSNSELESSDISDNDLTVEDSDNPLLNITSETELDEDDDGHTAGTTKQTKAEQLTISLLEKYREREGKQLYIRFPHRLPEDQVAFEAEVHALSPLIVKAHKPRQKHARFCLVDFNTKEERDTTLKNIRATARANPYFKIVASRPRTESSDFVKELAERKLQSLEKKKAKARLRRASKLAMQSKNFTSCIVVQNLPKSTTMSEVRTLFPNAVDIQIRKGKGKFAGAPSVAAVTLPSTLEARAAVKQQYSLGGTKLVVRFDTQQSKKKQVQVGEKRKAPSMEETTEEPERKKKKQTEKTQQKKISAEEKGEKNIKLANTKQNKKLGGKLSSKTKLKKNK